MVGGTPESTVGGVTGLAPAEAAAYVRTMLANLLPENYSESEILDYNPAVKADVYGVHNEDGRWYVKFYMQHGRITVASCHYPIRAIK